MLCTKLSRCKEEALEVIQAGESGIQPGEGVGLLYKHMSRNHSLAAME